jgi:uncharacterized membrane protein (UPF0127 family)
MIVISTAILLLAMVVVLYYFDNDKKEYSKPYEPSFTKNGELSFISHFNKSVIKTIDIEIADNDDTRAQGLMWRRTMPDSIGMFFIFDDEIYRSFWMKNTYISLDIIYVNKSMEIVSISENTITLSEMPIPSDKPAMYVVEVIAGFCYSHGIKAGDKIKFEIAVKQ